MISKIHSNVTNVLVSVGLGEDENIFNWDLMIVGKSSYCLFLTSRESSLFNPHHRSS